MHGGGHERASAQADSNRAARRRDCGVLRRASGLSGEREKGAAKLDSPQNVEKKLFSPRRGRIALSANERIAEFLDFAIQAKFAYVNKLRRTQSALVLFKAQTLSNQVELVLVFIIIRRSRFDSSPLGILHPNKKVSTIRLVIMIRLSRLEMQPHLPSNEPK